MKDPRIAYRVVAGTVGPYLPGDQFQAVELRAEEASRYLAAGILIAIDQFGEPVAQPPAPPFPDVPAKADAPAEPEPDATAPKSKKAN